MGNNNATNAKLFIEAVLSDVSGLSKELKGVLENVDSTIPFKFDSEKVEDAVLKSLKDTFKILNSGGFASKLNLGQAISQVFNTLQSDISENVKADFVYNFGETVSVFESFASQFAGDADSVIKTINKLNEDLGGEGIIQYLDDLQAVYKFVNSLGLKQKDKEGLLRSFTSSLGIGVDANGMGDAIGLKKTLEKNAEEFKNVNKYAVSIKEARNRLIELLGGSKEIRGWDELLSGSKSRIDTKRVEDIAGFISRIEALSGQKLMPYLEAKIKDAKTDDATRAQLTKLLELYSKQGGWAEYFQKWNNSDNENTQANLEKLRENNKRIIEMTKLQLEEREKALKEYEKYNATLLTKGISPQNTIDYDTKVEAVETSELSEEEKQRREIADKIAKEVEQLKDKLNVLKEIANLQKQVVTAGVESTPEFKEMEQLQDAIDNVTFAVDRKTDAFNTEMGTVHNVVQKEIADLKELKEKLEDITSLSNDNEKKTSTKITKKIKEQTEAQKKAAEEMGESVRKNSILGEIREEENTPNEDSQSKKGAKIKKRNLREVDTPLSTKTANEREAQALKDINENAEGATAGLQKFGETNEKIAQNITNVAESLEKEANALNSLAKTFQKFDDSKIVQQARKDKLKQDLTVIKEGMEASKKDTEDFKSSYTATIFKKDHLDDAAEQLRDAYKNVVSYREYHANDKDKDAILEMAKREAKYWDAYKEAVKQGLEESNLEAKRLTPESLGINLEKDADNRKILNDELNRRKEIYREYQNEVAEIQKEIKEVGKSSSSKKKTKETNDEIEGYREAIGIIKEYVEAQKALAEAQQNITPETSQVLFTPEQLEQFNVTIQGIITAVEKVETGLGTLNDKVDLSPIIGQLQGLNDILSVFINNISFDEFNVVFAFTVDKIIDKINDLKSALNLNDVIVEYESQITRLQEKLENLQVQLDKKNLTEETPVKAIFSSEQLEEFNTALINISGSLNKIQTGLGVLDDNSDVPSIIQSINEMVEVFKKLELLINDINNKKIKFGFSSNPDEKLIGEMNSAEVKESLTGLFDDAIKKIQDFKTNIDMSDTVKNFKQQISEMKQTVKSLEKALEQEKKARENDKAKIKAKEEKRIQEEKRKAEEKAQQEALEKERANQERIRKEQEALRKEQEKEEKQRLLKEEQAKLQQQQRIQQEKQKIQQKFAKIEQDRNERLWEQQEKEKEEKQQLLREKQEKIRQKFIESKNNLRRNEEIQKGQEQLAGHGQTDQLEWQKKQAEQTRKNIQFELEQSRLVERAKQVQDTKIRNISKTLEQNRLDEQNKRLEQTEQIKRQTQAELEQARLAEQAVAVRQKVNQEVKEYEKQFYNWNESGEGQLTFLNNEEYTKVIQEETEQTRKKAEEEAKKNPPSIEIPIKGQISFTSDEDINQIMKLFSDEAIQQTEKQFAKFKKTTGYIQSETDIEKFLKPYGDLTLGTDATKFAEELINVSDRIRDVKTELESSFDANGKMIGNPERVHELLEEYNNLTTQVKELKAEISSPLSGENIVLKAAKDTEKAEKELDELKTKVDTVIGKSSLFEAQTLKTINAYGAFNGEEGKRTDLITPDKLGEKYGDRFAKQQEQVQQLISKFREYKTAVEELETLRTSDNTTLEQLTEANDKVKNLKDNITTLSQTIKTSGIANASEEQLGALKNRLEIFLEKNPNLTLGIRQQIQEYIDILNSGASVSKTRYASMTADLNKFAAAQTSGTTIWKQMVGKMREGIAFLATKFSFYEIFNQFRQGFEVIHQFDDALTEMMKVSDETRLSLERYQKTTFDTADAIGTNALQIQNSTADFMRLGETLNEAAESAKSANVLMNVSEFQSIDEATKSLIAMSAAYDDLSKMNIIDKLNEVGNNFSISTSEAAEALQSSASALKTAGNDMDEALALITAGNAVVQDANKVGTGMRTVALRLTGTKSAKEELEEMGEETENVITTQSKLRDTIKEATAVASNGFKGFDILDDNGNYKSTYEINKLSPYKVTYMQYLY